MEYGVCPDGDRQLGLAEVAPSFGAAAATTAVTQPLDEASASEAEPLRVLIVDAVEEAAFLRDVLARCGEVRFEIDLAPHAAAALTRLANIAYHACIADCSAPGHQGLLLLAEARRRDIKTPVILVAEDAARALEVTAIGDGAADFLYKEECDPSRLERAIRFAVARSRTAARLDRLAQIDPLTGLANRNLLGSRLDHGLAAARRHRRCLAVIIVDLDRFKAINDRFGHAAGDEVLRAVAGRLGSRLRESDTVARLGGDEFAVVIEDLVRPEHAALVGAKLLDALAPPVPVDGLGELAVTASLGIAIFPRDGEEPGLLLRRADAAMYAAKAAGGERCRFHDVTLDQQRHEGALLVADLRRAIEENELVLYYQPEATLGSDMLGMSAVLRWQHPIKGLIEADRFRLLAEDSGLLDPLTDWLMTGVCRQARAWQRKAFRPFHISLPLLSRRQLLWSTIPERLKDKLRSFGLPRATIEIEVPERLLGEEVLAGGAGLEQLREAGLRVALADFGGGVGTLLALRDGTIQTVKLAPSLLEGVPEDPGKTRFVAGLVRLAKGLGLRVVARGVIRPDQLALLRREGSDAVQSALSTPPLPPEGCAQWLGMASRRGLPAAASAVEIGNQR